MADIIAMITQFIASIYIGYEGQLITLATYTIGMVVYAIVIWHFYRHLAKKEIFKKKEGSSAGYVLKYLILFPIISFIWFVILSIFLFFLAKDLPVESVLLASISIVSAVRAAAYYNEDLSRDMAKLIPLALLAISIIHPSYFSIELVIERIYTFQSLFPLILRYLLFVVSLEIILRLLYSVGTRFFADNPKK